MNPMRKHAYLLAGVWMLAAILAVATVFGARRLRSDSRVDQVRERVDVGQPGYNGGDSASAQFIPTRGMAECFEHGDGGQAAAKERFFAEIARRFRLAGFHLNAERPEASRAIIEDRDSQRQWLRRKGEELAPAVAVAGIETNSVSLATPYGICRLQLSKRSGDFGSSQGRTAVAEGSGSLQDKMSLGAVAGLVDCETSPGNWTFRREALMDYYEEVKMRPERLEAVFDTLAPIWFTDEADGKQKIEGYRVEPCGEEAFFAAVGFKEGDIVREVNGIRMDNRYAAEELIRRFADGDLEFAHIKMERNGEELVQSYLVE